MNNWQPIETAPREDGERILVYSGAGVSLAEWRTHFKAFSDPECGSLMNGVLEPTHWMPLPEPPDVPAKPEPVVSNEITLPDGAGCLRFDPDWNKIKFSTPAEWDAFIDRGVAELAANRDIQNACVIAMAMAIQRLEARVTELEARRCGP